MLLVDRVFYVRVRLGLPASGSWQDLKDHMREAGDVCYADVTKDGRGVVEFLHYDDMKYAVRKLDNSKFRSHEVCTYLLEKFAVNCCTAVIVSDKKSF